MRLACVVLVVSAGAWAQGAKPSVMPFPLEFKRVPAAMPKADRDGLVSDAERLLRTAGVQLVDFAKAETALADLKRQDCEREDVCLQQLAQKAETLYALYANVDFTLEGMVVVTGRVVRDDGKLVAPQQTVSLPKGKAKHREVAQKALTALYEQLEVGELPAVREVVAVAAPPVELPKVVEQLPPVEVTTQPVQVGPSPLVKGLLYGGLGIAVAGAATAIAGFGVGGAAKTTVQGGFTYAASEADARSLSLGRGLSTAGLVGLGVGAAAAAVGAVLWATSAGSPSVAVIPTAQGGAVVVGGSF